MHKFTYDDFFESVDDIKELMLLEDWKPDLIVGLVRGGAVPAVYLSHRLDVPALMLHFSTRDSKTGVEVEFDQNISKIEEYEKAGKRILIVDDIIDSGKTMQILLDKLNYKDYTNNIRIACLIYNVSQSVKPHYSYMLIDRVIDDRWFHFPWE